MLRAIGRVSMFLALGVLASACSTSAVTEEGADVSAQALGSRQGWFWHRPKPPPSSPGEPLGITAALSAGADHTCVADNGKLKCFGRNVLGGPTGQHSFDRGLEASDMKETPAIDFGSCGKAAALAVGAYHACAILDGGKVKCWGDNDGGALGLGDKKVHSVTSSGLAHRPFVSLGGYAKTISAGSGFTCALLSTGAVKCWGANGYGQLGLGDALARGDEPDELGANLPAVDLGTGKTARLVRAGASHACAILTDDSVKCWGLNNYGQLGLGDARRRGSLPGEMGDGLPAVDLGASAKPVELALGSYHSCVRFADHSVKCWGHNEWSELGLGDVQSRGDGPGEMGAALPAVDLGTNLGAKAISVGSHHTCALLDNGQVKCWGDNQYGWLGTGDSEVRGDEPGEMGDALPTVALGTGRYATHLLASQSNTCVALDNGKIKCWGSQWSGMLGIGPSGVRGSGPGQMGDALPGFRLANACSIKGFGSGFGYHSGCALLSDGRVKCWGSNSYGQLGTARSNNTGDEAADMGTALKPVALGTNAKVSSAGTGTFHSCALLEGGQVKCWGVNRFGELGQGDDVRRDGRASYLGDNLTAIDFGGHSAKSLAVGTQHNCAILDDGSVRCWGDNEYGKLGVGDTLARGAGLPIAPVELGTGRRAQALALSANHSCALLDDASVKCWGWNAYGQLGTGDSAARGDGPGEMGDALPAVRLGDGDKPTALAASYHNTCVLLETGVIKCWGVNNHGQLGVGDAQQRGNKPAHMGNALPAVQLGNGRFASAFTLGDGHGCALLDDGTVKCWGQGALGKLGTGNLLDVGTAPGQLGDALSPVALGTGRLAVAVAAGSQHSCALLDDATLKCWGANEGGRLGLGDTEDRGDQPGEMGAALPSIALGYF